MKKVSWGWLVVAFIIGFALCHPKHGHAKGRDIVVIQSVTGGNIFTGCAVLEDKPSYFAVSCDAVQDEGNTIFTGPAVKEESVFVFLPTTFQFYPYVCFQVGLDKYKSGNIYFIECLQGNG